MEARITIKMVIMATITAGLPASKTEGTPIFSFLRLGTIRIIVTRIIIHMVVLIAGMVATDTLRTTVMDIITMDGDTATIMPIPTTVVIHMVDTTTIVSTANMATCAGK